MKRLITVTLVIVSLVGLLILSGCPGPPTNPPDSKKAIVHITTVEGFKTTVYMGGIIQKSSIVPGFEHQYDTCYLTINNQTSADQNFQKSIIGPVFMDVSLSKGIFSFYMVTNEDPLLIDFDKSFVAYSQPDSVRAGEIYTLTLQEEVQQALVLVDANTVDEAPEIEIGLTKLTMQRQGDFWYAYVLNPGALYAKIDGTDVIKGFPFKQGDIYVWSAVKGNIITEDGFTQIIYI